MKKEVATFWLTNISPTNVSIADLNLTIKAYTSLNLLDKRHYQYTQEQLQKSAESGSVFRKRDKLVVRKVAPKVLKANVPFIHEANIPSRERSLLVIKEENYEELNISDEDFAKDNADTAHADTQPMLKKV